MGRCDDMAWPNKSPSTQESHLPTLPDIMELSRIFGKRKDNVFLEAWEPVYFCIQGQQAMATRPVWLNSDFFRNDLTHLKTSAQVNIL